MADFDRFERLLWLGTGVFIGILFVSLAIGIHELLYDFPTRHAYKAIAQITDLESQITNEKRSVSSVQRQLDVARSLQRARDETLQQREKRIEDQQAELLRIRIQLAEVERHLDIEQETRHHEKKESKRLLANSETDNAELASRLADVKREAAHLQGVETELSSTTEQLTTALQRGDATRRERDEARSKVDLSQDQLRNRTREMEYLKTSILKDVCGSCRDKILSG